MTAVPKTVRKTYHTLDVLATLAPQPLYRTAYQPTLCSHLIVERAIKADHAHILKSLAAATIDTYPNTMARVHTDGSALVTDILTTANKLHNQNDIETSIQWIPGHCDIPGNDRADKLAKQGTSKTRHDEQVSYGSLHVKLHDGPRTLSSDLTHCFCVLLLFRIFFHFYVWSYVTPPLNLVLRFLPWQFSLRQVVIDVIQPPTFWSSSPYFPRDLHHHHSLAYVLLLFAIHALTTSTYFPALSWIFLTPSLSL